MLELKLDEIIHCTQADMVVDGKDYYFESISIDTRKLSEGSIFIALRGDNFNGNNYILDAIAKGAKICIVDQVKFNKEDIKEGVTIIQVKDTKKALLQMAEYYRSKLNIKVVGITGSTGKTSTKDMVAAFLSSKYKVFKTKGNFNNEIGLPLMVFQLDSSYDVAVLEMGMSNLGEIHRLAEVARPDIAIITNVGMSHIENLKTRENILKAKMEITDYFNENNILIINADNDLLGTVEKNKFNLVRSGMNSDVYDFKAENIWLKEDEVSFDVIGLKNKIGRLSIPVPGIHNVQNALLALACARQLGLSLNDIQKGIKNIECTSMRLDIIKGNYITIINDCYNASPDSMKAAIDVEESLSGKRKVAIIGTMKELGDESYNAHKDVGIYARNKTIDFIIAIGDFAEGYKDGFNKDDKFIIFNDIEQALENIKNYILEGDIVLVKASRSMKFEVIVDKLKALND